MTTIREIIAFLRSIDETEESGTALGVDLDTPVTGARSDRQAARGHISWVARRALDERLTRVEEFAGSLLLCPVIEGLDRQRVALPCRHPRYAFARVVHACLPELTATRWPGHGDHGIWPDSSVGANTCLAAGVVIGSGTIIEDHVTIGANTCLSNVTVRSGTVIGCNCTIGQAGFGYVRTPDGSYLRFPHVGRVVIEGSVEIGSNACIDRGALEDTIIGHGVKIDNLVHIAHNVIIGRDALIIANSMIAGSVTIGDRAWIAPSTAILNQLTIGEGAVVGMGAVVIRNVDASQTVVGNPARALDGSPSRINQHPPRVRRRPDDARNTTRDPMT